VAHGRKIEDEVEARRCLSAAEASGLAHREWAREQGIDARSLNMWRVILARGGWTSLPQRRRRSKAAMVAAPQLVELVPRSDERGAGSDKPARYVLEIDGTRVEFGDDFSAPTLRRVLEVLRTC
jgi:transposase